MTSRDPRPEILRLEELALQVKAGDIKLPRFQRPFVWRTSDMRMLLDSIYKGYPIGSLLLWNSSQRLKSERDIAGLEIDADDREFYPTNYLLDGQQRLTTLCGALFWPGGRQDSIWNMNFDLNSETFIHAADPHLVNLFPLNDLIDTGKFIRRCTKFESHPDKSMFLERAERLLRKIKDYKVAVVKIGDMSLEEVAPIFERINSTGRKLTIVDLMMAATWSDQFDLSEEISSIRKICEGLQFSPIPDQSVLRSIAAATGLGINKEDIERLRKFAPDQLKSAANATAQALEYAIRFLGDRLGVSDLAFIPYGLQLTYLVEFFNLCPAPSDSQLEELSRWFWFTSATMYFAGSSSGQTSKDLNTIRQFARGERRQLVDQKEMDISALLFSKFSLKNASSTTFALLLNLQHPNATLDGRPLDDTHQRIKLGRFYGSFSPKRIGGLNIAKVIDPFSKAPSLTQEVGALEAHLLSPSIVDAVNRNDPGAYVGERGMLIAQRLNQLIGIEVNFVATDEMGPLPEPSGDDDQEAGASEPE